PGGRPLAAVAKARRLRGVRAGLGASTREAPDSTVIVLPHAESLAYGALAQGRRRLDRLCPLADTHAHHALARASSYLGERPSLPRAIQGFSHRARRSLACGAALSRTQSAAGESGRAGGTMAVVEFVAAPARACRAARDARRLDGSRAEGTG